MNRFTIPIQPVPFDSEVDQAVLDEETNNHGDGIPEETNEDFSLNTHGTHMEDERDNEDDLYNSRRQTFALRHSFH